MINVKNKITLKEFFKMDKAATHCNNREDARILLEHFDELNKRWRGGGLYTNIDYWDNYTVNTCYSNNGGFGTSNSYQNDGYKIYEYEDVIFMNDKSSNNFSDFTKIRSVTINDKKKITTVVFTDGDVKMVKCGENDTYSPEMGIVYCMALKYSGLSKTQFKKMINGLLENRKK